MKTGHQNLGRGFALVATLMMLALLMLVGLALLGLAGSQAKNSRIETAQEEARANARLALMIALGELQKEMGPDQRVAAKAAILDQDPATPEIDGVRHPHWLTVYDTTIASDHSKITPWSRDRRERGLQDARHEDYDPRNHVRSYLVSGGNQLDESADEDSFITIVGSGSASTDQGGVEVPSVRIGDSGSYAWWVQSLNQKANISVASSRDQGEKRPLVELVASASSVDPSVLEGVRELSSEHQKMLLSLRSLELVARKNPTDLRGKYFHSMTGYSRSILANARDGGLQRDLTVYLREGEVASIDPTIRHYQGIKNEDYLVGPMNRDLAKLTNDQFNKHPYSDIAPTFALLRDWAEMARKNRPEARSFLLNPPPIWGNHPFPADPDHAFQGLNQQPTDPRNLSRTSLAPILVEGVTYNHLMQSRESPDDPRYQFRFCLYPRISLWNPFSRAMQLPATIVRLSLKGDRSLLVETKEENAGPTGNQQAQRSQRLLQFTIPGLTLPDEPSATPGSAQIGQQENQAAGQLLMAIPPISIPAGQTLTFSPEETQEISSQEYIRMSPNGPLSTNRYAFLKIGSDQTLYHSFRDLSHDPDELARLSGRLLQDEETPDPPRPTVSAKRGFQSLMELKLGPAQSFARGTDRSTHFAGLPQIAFISTSLSMGRQDDLLPPWDDGRKAPVILHNGRDEIPPPNFRTREGMRLRWWDEMGAPRAANARHSQFGNTEGVLQTAALANWNLRASMACRNPFDNLSGIQPHFHGVYHRDPPNPALSWQATLPRLVKGSTAGFPFTSPARGPEKLILFEIPDPQLGIPSIAFLRHLKFSDYVWHPSYVVGNSLVDPRVPRNRTIPKLPWSASAFAGWNQQTLGKEEWANRLRELLGQLPEQGNEMVFDLSFEANYSLWDQFFFSTGGLSRKARFLENPETHPLPNSRLQLWDRHAATPETLNDFFKASSHLAIEGGFDINSVEKDAWKAVLAANRRLKFDGARDAPFPRHFQESGGEYDGSRAKEDQAYVGFRSLDEEELDRLAEEIVEEVKRRAPFFGLADFVNRRLNNDSTGLAGPIESAIWKSGINQSLDAKYPVDRKSRLGITTTIDPPTEIQDSTRLRLRDKPKSTAWGVPGYLTQGDVLQVIGSSLSPRSDSFLIRGYGESKDARGKVVARAWCEAIVQRIPTPVRPDSITGLNCAPPSPDHPDFGRQFRLISFRWLAPDEV